jgi:hypothetical protein
MSALLLLGEAMALSGLAYGCYLCIANRRLSDEEGIAREFRADAGLELRSECYDPMGDPRVAGDIGFLL